MGSLKRFPDHPWTPVTSIEQIGHVISVQLMYHLIVGFFERKEEHQTIVSFSRKPSFRAGGFLDERYYPDESLYDELFE